MAVLMCPGSTRSFELAGTGVVPASIILAGAYQQPRPGPFCGDDVRQQEE